MAEKDSNTGMEFYRGLSPKGHGCLWAHDYLYKNHTREYLLEDLRVLAGWEGLDQIYFSLLKTSGQENFWAGLIAKIDRISGAAYNIEGVGEITAAEEVRTEINRKSGKKPNKHQVERISAVTGLMTLNALREIAAKRPDLVEKIAEEVETCEIVPPEYKGPTIQMLNESIGRQTPDEATSNLMSHAETRISQLIGFGAKNVFTGLTSGIVKSMVGGLYRAMDNPPPAANIASLPR